MAIDWGTVIVVGIAGGIGQGMGFYVANSHASRHNSGKRTLVGDAKGFVHTAAEYLFGV